MNNCEIKSPPVFSQEIPKWDRNTYADGNAMGAVVEQLFNNTVYNKEELKEKVDTEGGDISETQVSVLDESTEAFPVPMSGDKAKGLWGKLKKWQQDCLAKFGNYVLTSMITNQHVNSTSNIPSSALVYLMQQGVTQLNRDKNPKVELIASYNNDIVVSPATWVTAFNHQLPAGLYIIKHSAFAIYGVNGLSISMDAAGSHEQQTDRSMPDNKGVRGVIGTNIYYFSSPGAYIGQIYVDHSTTATVKNNLKILKLL